MKKNIQIFIERVRYIIQKHELAPGAYARWTINDGSSRNMGINEYGCADAANILYTIGDFPKDPALRQAFISTLQGMQQPDTGLFVEATHHPIHTTAHCAAALELFDALPLHRMTFFDPYRTKEGLYQFLDSLDWAKASWSQSHRGAGIYAALNVAEEATKEWNDWYFAWFWDEADPQTGLWRKGFADTDTLPIYEHMAGSFHYLFNHEHARMPLRYPDKMIDSCLDMYQHHTLRDDFGKIVGFLELDWVYCITRASRQCNHRFEECVEAVRDFANQYIDYLLQLDPDTVLRFDDLHMLFGAISCIAELQQFLPGYIITEKPLKLVLDRRPFV